MGPTDSAMDTDPTAIRSLAISATDLVSAVEATADGSEAVLRVTPPFSGRMRARLHVVQADEDDGTIHVPPTALVEEPPPYPTPDETADELRSRDDATYSVDCHREYHEQRVDAWRTALLDSVADTVSLPAVDHEIDVSVLGT